MIPVFLLGAGFNRDARQEAGRIIGHGLYTLKGARNPRRISDFMKKQYVTGLTQLQNRYLLAPRLVHLPVAGPRLDRVSWIPSPNVCGSQGGSLRKTTDDILCKEVWTPRLLTRRVIASTLI